MFVNERDRDQTHHCSSGVQTWKRCREEVSVQQQCEKNTSNLHAQQPDILINTQTHTCWDILAYADTQQQDRTRRSCDWSEGSFFNFHQTTLSRGRHPFWPLYDIWLTPLWHLYDTCITPECHLYDTCITILWHLYYTWMSPIWHLYDTSMTPEWHLPFWTVLLYSIKPQAHSTSINTFLIVISWEVYSFYELESVLSSHRNIMLNIVFGISP